MDFIAAQLVSTRRKASLDRERLAEVAHLKKCAKHKGRNHWKNWYRRKMAADARKAAQRAAEAKNNLYAAYKAEVRDFWTGAREDMPKPLASHP